MSARPTEVKRLAEVLSRDYDTAEEAAKAAFEAVEQMIAERSNFVISVVHTDIPTGTHLVQSYGIFTTRNQAEKALGKVISPGGTITSKGAIAQLTVIN